MKITRELFGNLDDKKLVLFTLTNNNGIIAQITNYGGIITSLLVPDKNNVVEDVVLGFDDPQKYFSNEYLKGCPYLGSIIGRVGNRIADGKFTLDGIEYSLATNEGANHLHGGKKAFDKVVWDAEEISNENKVGVKLSYLSKDMEEGYPGNLEVTVTYTLNNNNELIIDYEAETDKACPVNLTNHSYFNLTACKRNVLNHEIQIFADAHTATNQNLIPAGEIYSVVGTNLDFTKPHTIGERIEEVGGYDHNYVLDNEAGDLFLTARVTEPESGRTMEVLTTEPGVQFYTGNFLDGAFSRAGGQTFDKHYGFCLETQHYPDSVNQSGFPNTILRPGEKYIQTTIYRFV